MMEFPHQKEFDFAEIEAALLNQQKPFPASLLYFFSDITPEDLEKIEVVWPQVETLRRRGLLEDMESLAESDTILFFDTFARMCLQDADPVARATAIRLLWQSQEEDLVPVLVKMLQEDPESIVRAAAATGLGEFVYLGELEEIEETTYKHVLKTLMNVHLSSDEVLVRRRALESLGYACQPDIQEFIQQAFDSNDEEWLQSALYAMGRSCDQRWTSSVLQMIDHPDSTVRFEAVRAAGELEIQEARDLLFDLLEEGTDDDELYYAIIWSLSKIGGEGVRSLIEANLDETDDEEEIQILEEALENLNFTEQVNLFDMMYVEEDDPDAWDDDEFEDED